MIERRIPVSGDPFYAASRRDEEDRPHACYDGTVFIGEMVEDPEMGAEVEVVEALSCKRCRKGEG
jgi:hypothetical protein